jgi:hypothetical protein
MLFLFPIGVFVALLILQVESMTARLVMAGIVVGLWLLAGSLGAGVGAALLSVGIIIAAKVPRIRDF